MSEYIFVTYIFEYIRHTLNQRPKQELMIMIFCEGWAGSTDRLKSPHRPQKWTCFSQEHKPTKITRCQTSTNLKYLMGRRRRRYWIVGRFTFCGQSCPPAFDKQLSSGKAAALTFSSHFTGPATAAKTFANLVLGNLHYITLIDQILLHITNLTNNHES